MQAAGLRVGVEVTDNGDDSEASGSDDCSEHVPDPHYEPLLSTRPHRNVGPGQEQDTGPLEASRWRGESCDGDSDSETASSDSFTDDDHSHTEASVSEDEAIDSDYPSDTSVQRTKPRRRTPYDSKAYCVRGPAEGAECAWCHSTIDSGKWQVRIEHENGTQK